MKKFKRFDIFIYVLIIANILAMVLESHVSIKLEYENIFYYFELISISIFSFEYLFRIYINYKESKWHGVKGYVFSFFGVIDLVAILPFYIKEFVLLDGRFFRILRLFRLSRIFKLGRSSKSLKLFIKALDRLKTNYTLPYFFLYSPFYFQHLQYISLKTMHSLRYFPALQHRSGGLRFH